MMASSCCTCHMGQMRLPQAVSVVPIRCSAGPQPHRQLHRRRLQAAQADAADTAAPSEQQQQQQQQQTVTVRLRKPVGVVFAQNKNGPVFVEEVTPGSNADKSGQIQVGDVLSQCSAVVLKAGKEGQYEREGYGQRPYDNWETIMFNAEGCEFKTVMSALKSNNERWGIMDVTMVFRKPTAGEAGLCVKDKPQA